MSLASTVTRMFALLPPIQSMEWVTAFNFDWGVRIQVVDDSGTSLVDFRESGRDVVDAEYNQSYGNHIRIAYKDRLTKLLEDARVRDALTVAGRGASD